jgi:hypothetical protein
MPHFLLNEMGYPSSWIGGLLLFALQAAGFVAPPVSATSPTDRPRNIIMASMVLADVRRPSRCWWSSWILPVRDALGAAGLAARVHPQAQPPAH